MNVWLFRSPSPRNCGEWTGDCCLGPMHGCCGGEEFIIDESEKTIARPGIVYVEPSDSEKNKDCCSESCAITTAGAICFSPLILAAGILMGAVSGAGLLLKKIGLGCNEKSRAYQSAIKAYLAYEEARDNPRRLELHHNLEKLKSLIQSKQEMKEEELFKEIPQKIFVNQTSIELSKEQILQIQKEILEKHQESTKELLQKKEIFLLNHGEEFSKLNEESEKCREIFEKAQNEYFELIGPNEKSPLIEQKD